MVVLSKVRMPVDIFVNVLALTTNRNQLEFSCLQRLSNKRLGKCDSQKKATLNHHSHALMTEYHYVGRRNTLIRKRPDLTTFIFQFFFLGGKTKIILLLLYSGLLLVLESLLFSSFCAFNDRVYCYHKETNFN